MCALTRLISDGARKLRTARTRLAAEDGLTIIEVAVTGLMVGLISLSLVGLDAAGKTAADQRRRAQAFQVAQADQERIKGLSADQIATLNQSRTVTLDSVTYTVNSTGQFLSSSANSASCSSTAAAADYAKVISTVDWASNNRGPITLQSVTTPRAGGSLLVQTVDQNQAPISGARVNVAGGQQTNSAVRRFGTTDSGGCTIFGALLEGDYTLSPVLSGYVDYDGSAAPSTTVTTTAGNTTTYKFTLGRAGAISANFKTTIGATTYTNQEAPSLSWENTSMAGPNFFVPTSVPNATITTGQTLFPFNSTTPSGPYVAWAGKCAAAKGTPTSVGVNPGATTNATGPGGSIAMPAMFVNVTYNGANVKPDHIKLTDSCGQTWQAAINSASTLPATTGWLDKPGQPYGTYSICADYKYTTGTTGSSYRKVTITNRPNTSYTAANSSTVPILLTSTTGFC